MRSLDDKAATIFYITRIYFSFCLQVSNLFARDEMDEILNELIAPMKKDYPRRVPSLEELYEYYMERCRANLHVVLCFSPVGEKFRTRYSIYWDLLF